MNSFLFTGPLLKSTKTVLKRAFACHGLNLKFTNTIHKYNIFLVDEITGARAKFSSILGYADKHKNTAYVLYPTASKVYDACLDTSGIADSDRLFALVCVHEALHLLGHHHCTTKGCLMAKISCLYSKSGYCLSCMSLKRQQLDLCDSCSIKLAKYVKKTGNSPRLSSIHTS